MRELFAAVDGMADDARREYLDRELADDPLGGAAVDRDAEPDARRGRACYLVDSSLANFERGATPAELGRSV